jgi:glycosyltransferase involved in cell wall biosynthesis
VSQPTSGGVAGYVQTIAQLQLERGWSVAVACPAAGDLAERVERLDAPHFVWDATRTGYSRVPVEMEALRLPLQRFRPDVVHLHSSKAGLTGRALIRGSVATVFQPHAWSFNASRLPAVGLWERVAARWAHVTVCVSEAERADGRAHGIAGDLRVVPNAVDTTAFAPARADQRLAARRSLGIAEAPLAVCLGRLAIQKGQDRLLAVWPRVRSYVGNAALALVGDGPMRPELEQRAVPGVRIVGHADDVRPWLAAADVVAMPSRWEGMSIALLEAMAMGKSVVASDVAGAQECLGRSRGCVLPDVDEAFADAVARRLADPVLAADEGRLARAWTLAYTTDDLCNLLADAYDGALKRRMGTGAVAPRVAA